MGKSKDLLTKVFGKKDAEEKESPSNQTDDNPEEGNRQDGSDTLTPPDPTQIHDLTVFGLARRFIVKFGGRVWFCTDSKRCLFYDGKRFSPNESIINGAVRETIEAVFDEAKLDTPLVDEHDVDVSAKDVRKFACRNSTPSAFPAVLKSAATYPEVQATEAEFDANPELLNCRNATVDLRTGESRGHDPKDKLIHMAGGGLSS